MSAFLRSCSLFLLVSRQVLLQVSGLVLVRLIFLVPYCLPALFARESCDYQSVEHCTLGTVELSLCYSAAPVPFGFGIQQTTAAFTTKESRILPLHILHSMEMWVLIIQTSCSIGILFITIYYIPLYFQFVRGESTVRSAVDLLPFLFTSVSAMLISGRLITSFGCYKLWFIVGSSLAFVMSVYLYTAAIDATHGQIYGYLVLGGIGTGLCMP